MKKKRKTVKKDKTFSLIIENFVGLQKAMTNLSIKFEALSNNLSKLLEVLELSAKTYLEKNKEIDESGDLTKRINYLIEQNKAIAEGLLLLDDSIRKNQENKNLALKEKNFSPKPLSNKQ